MDQATLEYKRLIQQNDDLKHSNTNQLEKQQEYQMQQKRKLE